MLYTTASKYLQKLWNWPYVHSTEKIITVPLDILSNLYNKKWKVASQWLC